MSIITRAAIARPPHPTAWEITELELQDPKAHEVRVKVTAPVRPRAIFDEPHHARRRPHPDDDGRRARGRLRQCVEAVGPDVTRVREGDKVVLSYIPACGVCRRPCSTGHSSMCVKGLNAGTGMFEDGTWRFHEKDGTDVGGFCSLGTFSQHVVVSEYAAVPLRIDFQDIPWEVLCLTGCGVPTGAGDRRSTRPGCRFNDAVVIFGSGGVGSNAVQGARFAGAQHVVVVDPVEFKREMATSVFGATKAFATAQEAHDYVNAVTWGQLADKVILTPDAVTEEMLTAAVNMTGKGGKVQVTAVGHFGERNMTFRAGALITYHRQVRGALAGDSNLMYDIPKLLGLYKTGQLKLDELVTRKYALDEINQAYQDMHDGKNIRGVIIHEH